MQEKETSKSGKTLSHVHLTLLEEQLSSNDIYYRHSYNPVNKGVPHQVSSQYLSVLEENYS